MSLLDATDPAPPSKVRRYIILAVVAVVGVYLISMLVSHEMLLRSQEQVVENFLNTVAAGNMQQAYQLWQPTSSYSLKDFEDDWGPDGYYGPIKSFKIDSAYEPRRSTSDVAVRVLLSPYQPFPKSDTIEQNRTKSVTIWVNRSTRSLSTGPPAM